MEGIVSYNAPQFNDIQDEDILQAFSALYSGLRVGNQSLDSKQAVKGMVDMRHAMYMFDKEDLDVTHAERGAIYYNNEVYTDRFLIYLSTEAYETLGTVQILLPNVRDMKQLPAILADENIPAFDLRIAVLKFILVQIDISRLNAWILINHGFEFDRRVITSFDYLEKEIREYIQEITALENINSEKLNRSNIVDFSRAER